jgi:hypothetical protein
MTIAVFSSSSPPSSPPKLGDKVYTTDDPGKVSTRRRRGSLLVGRVIECCEGDGEVMVAMRRVPSTRKATP